MYKASFTPTISASVELRVLIFCFVDIYIEHPFPIDMVASVWILILGCTTKDVSIHQFNELIPSVCKVILSSLVSLRNLKHLPSFFQSSLSEDYTLVQREEIASNKSGHVLFPRYNSCETM